MRILFLTSRLPFPPNRGDRLRTYHLLRNISQDHAITLVSFATSDRESELSGELDAFCQDIHVLVRPKLQSRATVLTHIWQRLPMQALYYRSAEMQRLVDELLHSDAYDAVYVHLFRMAPYVASHENQYRIVDLTDVISSEIAASLPYRSFLSRLIYHLEQPRIAAYEREVAGWAEETWLISRKDRSLLAASTADANLRVVPNGVDWDHFYPLSQSVQAKGLLFVGHLDVFHNIDAVSYLLEEIFPLVRRQIPDCTLQIAGPGTGVQFSKNRSSDGVTLRGFVPDLNVVLNEAAVFIAPLRFSAGVQNKVLEAMAAGVPVVTTPNVNEGLGAQSGRDLLLGREPDELADAAVSLLVDEKMRKEMGLAGRRFVQEHFTWQAALDRLALIEGRLA